MVSLILAKESIVKSEEKSRQSGASKEWKCLHWRQNSKIGKTCNHIGTKNQSGPPREISGACLTRLFSRDSFAQLLPPGLIAC